MTPPVRLGAAAVDATLVRGATESLPAAPAALVAAAAAAPQTAAEHARLVAEVAAVEVRAAGAAPTGLGFRAAAWNAERVKFVEDSAALVRSVAPDVLFLTEADSGMARSGNRHTAADLADRLGMGFAFGVEFLELGLGDEREQRYLAGQRNRLGFHGNALLARGPLRDPFVLRLDDGAVWWVDAARGQKRLGWRMAVAAWVELGERAVLAAAVHLESKSDAADRTRQTERLVACLDAEAAGAPVLIGGDFNTKALAGPAETWFERPADREPLFGALREAGFGWTDANRADTTQRPSRTSTPREPHARLDWLFYRGLAAADPVTVPALDESGRALSDHDLMAARFR